jgi:hypothetical protein
MRDIDDDDAGALKNTQMKKQNARSQITSDGLGALGLHLI